MNAKSWLVKKSTDTTGIESEVYRLLESACNGDASLSFGQQQRIKAGCGQIVKYRTWAIGSSGLATNDKLSEWDFRSDLLLTTLATYINTCRD